jgi:competence protein ComEC
MMKKVKNSIVLLLVLVMSLVVSGCSAKDIGQNKISDDQLQVHFISVGQGDSELIKLPTGENVLIDSGPPSCRDTLIKYLKDKGVKEINMAITTHPHTDHIGCMKDIFETFKVDNIMRPDCDYDSLVYTNFLYSIEENKINEIIPQPGYTFDEGDAHFEVLGPLKKYDDCNDMSIVVMMTYGKNKFLFTGDMQSDAEKDLINAGCDLNADVLKVGHHGSNTSSCEEFLDKVTPSIAVIEVGVDNEYNLPSDKTIARIAQNGATVYRTDKSGNIIICSNGKKLTVVTDDSTEGFINNVLFGTDSDEAASSQ